MTLIIFLKRYSFLRITKTIVVVDAKSEVDFYFYLDFAIFFNLPCNVNYDFFPFFIVNLIYVKFRAESPTERSVSHLAKQKSVQDGIEFCIESLHSGMILIIFLLHLPIRYLSDNPSFISLSIHLSIYIPIYP